MKPKTIYTARINRIDELREDMLVLDLFIRSTRDPKTKNGLRKLRSVLQNTIFSLEKGLGNG